MRAVHLAVFEVADHTFMPLAFFQRFAAIDETLPGGRIAPQVRQQPAQGILFSFAIAGQPDLRHAARGNEFVQIETCRTPRGRTIRYYSIF
jgi:hypothetical protein